MPIESALEEKYILMDTNVAPFQESICIEHEVLRSTEYAVSLIREKYEM